MARIAARLAASRSSIGPDGTALSPPGSAAPLYEIEVLGVARGGRQVQHVERGATPEGKVFAQEVIRKEVAQGARQKEILLDVILVGPGTPIIRPNYTHNHP